MTKEKKFYYETPPDNIFNEVKEKSIKIWKTYDNTYGYADEKIDYIKTIGNIKDNMMTIIAMFDINNQMKLAGKLSFEANKEITEKLIAVNHPAEYNPFALYSTKKLKLTMKNYE
jgi:hypothetical protein